MVFNATFNTISAISWQSVVFLEETGIPEKTHRPAANHWQALSHNVVSRSRVVFELKTLVVIDTECTGNHKSNYHTITITAVPIYHWRCLNKVIKCVKIKTQELLKQGYVASSQVEMITTNIIRSSSWTG